MKTIFLLRHAHAVNDKNDDFNRVLSETGIIKCISLANTLKEYIQNIDLILSSPSLRTKQTIENILSYLDIAKKIQYDQDLYTASVNSLFQNLRSLNDDNKNILIISHNPAISELGLFLAKNSISSSHYFNILQGFSPGSLALYNINTEIWDHLDPDCISIKEFWR